MKMRCDVRSVRVRVVSVSDVEESAGRRDTYQNIAHQAHHVGVEVVDPSVRTSRIHDSIDFLNDVDEDLVL